MDEAKEKQDIRILVVDDVEVNLIILEEIIKNMGYQAMTAQSVKEAVELMQDTGNLPQIILSDISMPDIDGFAFCTMLKKNPYTRNIPLIFISAMDQAADKSQGLEMGAVDYISKPFDRAEVELRINTHLKVYMLQKELEENNRSLTLLINGHMEKMYTEQKNIMIALARLVEFKESQESNEELNNAHYYNIPYNSRMLAQGMQFYPKFEEQIDDQFIDTVESSSALHDIGKIMIPDYILLKKGALTAQEWDIMCTHTSLGAKALSDIYKNVEKNDFIDMAIDIAHYHHENWDGSGYPCGLKGGEIPLAARIVKVVDVYDALLNQRAYKDRIPKEEALEWMADGAGKYFDPDIIQVFLKIHRNFIYDADAVKKYHL